AIQWLYAIEDTGEAPAERGFLGLCSHLPMRSAGWPLLLISAAVIGARTRREAYPVLAMLVFVSALSSRAHATTLSLDLENLIMRSDSIVYGKVIDTRIEVSGTLLETIATIEVEDTLFGPIRAQAEVRVPGGCLGELCLTVGGAPQPIHGSRVLVFLDNGRPVGLSAGYLRLDHDVAWVPLHGDADCSHAHTQWSLAEIRRLSR
ncbi:MAG: hypothetical protein QGG40_19770, partial [Myxococcota bacterium]|nr:hypothetical protein [Myxococcota bacterium]